MHLSVCIPVYRAEKILPELVRRISLAVASITKDYEIVLVEDCGPDNSWGVIQEICRANKHVIGIKLAKNFGQQNAITAALSHAKGEYVVVMDCDLQEDPADIPKLYAEAQKGFHIVYTAKIKRKHSIAKNIAARLYGYLLFKLTGNGDLYKTEVGAFSMISRKVVDAFLSFKDVHRHYILVLRNLGFKSTIVPIAHHERFEGKSSYTFMRSFLLAIDGIVSQSNRLLYLSVFIGLVMFLASSFFIVLLIVLYFTRGFLSGWTSIMVMLLFSTGLIMVTFGIHGLYLGKVFDQAKGRPLYIVEETCNYVKL